MHAEKRAYSHYLFVKKFHKILLDLSNDYITIIMHINTFLIFKMIGRIKLGEGGKCDQSSLYEIPNELKFLKGSKQKQNKEKR